MRLIKTITTGVAAVAMMSAAPVFAASKTLDEVKERGILQCVVNPGLTGFAAPDDKGVWQGFDIDLCRAIAVAIFNDPKKTAFKPGTGKTRFTILRSGEGDVITRNSTWTFIRDVDLGFDFKGVNYYDGQGFMVKKELGVDSAKELDGATVCVQTGSTTELNLADYFRSNNMTFQPIITEDAAESRQNFEKGACDVYTTDASQLAAQRSAMQNPAEFKILPEIISKEPLGPVVRHGDNQWGDIVQWTLNALIVAEELGVTSKNVDDLLKSSKNPEVKRLLGLEGSLGSKLGLKDDWAANVIRTMGNYGEIFERHIGQNTPIGLARGLNALWNNGGILYAAPFR
ncbi:MAG: amino acid ABC transporter substrate-binding protein [Chromatiales bacterium]|jgi:general L-amino acid transport system substrate-binding protein|nr:amino acid ABC transporter substrate-binding protein [Chromatiales bacterium]